MEYHFDVNAVVRIRYEQENQTDHVWVDGQTLIKKVFFGLIDKKIVIESGWYEDFEKYPTDFDTTERLIERGYIVKLPSGYKCNDGMVKHAAWIKIYLINDEVYKSFKSNKEAEDWIHNLKMKSGKLFEIIKP